VAIGLGVFTGGFFTAHSVASGWVGATAPAKARGQASGLYLCAYYLGSSIGGTAGTAVYGAAGWTTLIAVTACWLALAGAATVYAGLRGANTRSSTQNLSRNTGAPLSR
jgi:YNFM family putative membrane transporter